MSLRRTYPWVALLLAAFIAQCVLAIHAKSVTFDEPAYIASGYLYLTRGSFHVDPEHPPLFKYLLALPLLALRLLPPEQVPHWNGGRPDQFLYGASFLFQNSVDAERILHLSRYVVAVVAAILGFVVWRWTRELFGAWAGLAALVLYCFCPTVLAHSALATLDLAVTAAMTGALFAWWRLSLQPTFARAVLAGSSLAVALLVKCSAVILVGCIPLFLVAALRWHGRGTPEAPRQAGGRVWRTRLAGATLVAVGVAVLLVQVAWGPSEPGVERYVSTLRLVAFQRERLMDPTYQRFCWGRYSARGFWWYFFAAFVVKTPLPTLILLSCAVIWRLVRRVGPRFHELFALIPGVLLLAATVVVRENVGVRYILPVYPLLFVLLGGFVQEALARPGPRLASPRGYRIRAGTLALLASWYVGGTLAIGPHYLAFFNELAGGPAGGIRYLDDSNIDWGQDLKSLARYLHDHGIPEVKLLYTPVYLAGLAAPYYGIKATPLTVEEIAHPRPGWYAVSAHALQRPVVARGPGGEPIRFHWLNMYEPVARLGYSLYLYRFDEGGESPPQPPPRGSPER